MKRVAASLIGVIGMLALLVGLNMIVNRFAAGWRLDLTEQKLFTLSPGTRAVLAGVKEPVTLRLFYSPELGARIPQYGAHSDRVHELLREYAALAPGKIKLEFHNPEPFSGDEDRATAYGLQAVPLDQSGEKVFFGLQGTNLLDDERSIPFFQPERERFLEYDLTRLVQDLSGPHKPVVGVMTPLKLNGDPRLMMARPGADEAGAPWAVTMALHQNYLVRDIPPNAACIVTDVIDPDMKVLLLAHPQHLSDATLYCIDQFVMHGGKLLAMVAPSNETLGADRQADPSSDLKRLFDAWGVVYDPNLAVGDLDGAWKVRAKAGGGDAPVPYVGYFSVRDGINHDDPATAELQEVVLANPGFFTVKPSYGLSVTPLLTTSAHSAPIPASEISGDPDPARILASFQPDGQHRMVAARLRGTLHSAFDKAPDGAPQKAKDKFLAQSDGPANIVLIADTDMLSDRFWTRSEEFFGSANPMPFADNGTLITNLVGSLAGGDALIGLRSRGGVSRPFEVVDALQRDAEARYRETETALSKHLDETNKKLDDLRGGRDGTQNAALNAEQLAAMAELKGDVIATRGKLRQVQFELRRDITALQTRLLLFDIVLVPALLLLVAMAMAWVRRARRTRRPA